MAGHHAIRVVFAVVGIVIGVSAGISFAVPLENVDAGAFGFASGIVAAVTLTVHILYYRGYWTYQQYSSLVWLMYSGCITQLCGVVGFIVYLILGILEYQETHEFVVKGRNFFLVCVWCFMTWKWGFLLFFYSRLYRRKLRHEPEHLITNSE